MARKRKTIEQSPAPAESAAEAAPPTGQVHREADTRSGITVLTYDASDVLVIGPDDDVWKRYLDEISSVRRPGWAGAFVLVKPPADATDEFCEALRAAVVAVGARAVRFMPRPRALVVSAAKSVGGNGISIRGTVEQLVAEANTRDREALRALVESTLAQVGL